jgi:pimeloyl-ACP methyl ester carboxylesterase
MIGTSPLIVSGTVNEQNVMSVTSAATAVSIVLVHGGFVDGSGWQGVYNILKKDGYSVSIVQNPTVSLGDDVAATKRVIAAQPGPVVLVGHSYGGAVITEAGNDPKVAALVYITAVSVDCADPLEYQSEMAALALGSVTFTAQRGSTQRAIRARPELRRTSEHCFNLVLVLSGSWQVAQGGRLGRFAPGDLIFCCRRCVATHLTIERGR